MSETFSFNQKSLNECIHFTISHFSPELQKKILLLILRLNFWDLFLITMWTFIHEPFHEIYENKRKKSLRTLANVVNLTPRNERLCLYNFWSLRKQHRYSGFFLWEPDTSLFEQIPLTVQSGVIWGRKMILYLKILFSKSRKNIVQYLTIPFRNVRIRYRSMSKDNVHVISEKFIKECKQV